jgi:hypothetical protein
MPNQKNLHGKKTDIKANASRQPETNPAPHRNLAINLQTLASILIVLVSIIALITTHKYAILDQRAWVNVASIQNFDRNAKTFIGKVQVNIKNTGKTPAFNVKMWAIARQTKDKSLPDLKSELETKKEYLDGVRIIMPGPENGYQPEWADKSKGEERVFLDQSILDEIKSGQAIFVYRRIDYDDVSGDPHWTTYCSQLNHGEIWITCEKYNETDRLAWWRRLW